MNDFSTGSTLSAWLDLEPQTRGQQIPALAFAILLAGLVTILSACGGGGGGSSSGGASAAAISAQTNSSWRVELTGTPSYAIWGAGPDDLFIEGGDGFVVHYDGTDFVAQSIPVDATVRAIWGFASDDVYAISGDEILYFDGDEWQSVYRASNILLDIWGSGPDEIHAVGVSGLAVYFDGQLWSEVETGVTWSLDQVEGTRPDLVYAVSRSPGDPEQVLRFDGSTWRVQTVNGAFQLGALAANPATGRIFMGDSTGFLFVGSGNSFADFSTVGRPVETLAIATELELFGSDDLGRIFLWADRSVNRFSFPAAVQAVWASPWGYTYGVGNAGQIVFDDGAEWNVLRPGFEVNSLRTVFGAPDGALFALGDPALLFDTEAGVWVKVPRADPSAGSAGSAVSQDFAVAVGFGGVINHWDGTRWTDVSSPTTQPLRDVWAASETDAFAVGFFGAVLHYDGDLWSQTTSLGGGLNGVHGTAADDVFACGQVGQVFHYDGSVWGRMRSSTSQTLNAIWAVSTSNVFAVGGGGTVIHYDGTSWESMAIPTSETLVDVWARDSNSVYALSASGAVFRFNGESWTARRSPSGPLATSLWGTDDGLLATGRDGYLFGSDF